MEQALKNATEANAKSMDIITEKDKTISAKDAEIEKLKKQLADKPVATNVSEAPTADKDKEVKEVTYRAPRTIMNAIYPSRKLDEVTVKITDKKKIQELESNGYRIAS